MVATSLLRYILLAVEGPASGKTYELKGDEVTLGSSGHIRLPDTTLESVHVVFLKRGSTYAIRKGHHAATLFVNSHESEGESLNSMDEIRIGESLLIFSIGEQPRNEDLEPTVKFSRPTEEFPYDMVDDSEVPASERGERREFTTRKMEAESDRDGGAERRPRGALPKIMITLLSGPSKGSEYVLHSERIIIGRSSGEIMLDDVDVSRKHCSIEVHGRGRVYLHDNASTNGTFLNDAQVSYSLLKSGDRIKVGSTILKITIR